MKPTLKHAGRKKQREAEDEPLYKPSIFLYLFLRLKICDISSILNVKRRLDRIVKIRLLFVIKIKLRYTYLIRKICS